MSRGCVWADRFLVTCAFANSSLTPYSFLTLVRKLAKSCDNILMMSAAEKDATSVTYPHSSLDDLPTELLLEIGFLASSISQGNYRSFMLVSRKLYDAAQLNCISAVPVILEGYESLSSFERLLHRYPELGGKVRYLWITGIGATNRQLSDSVLRMCTNIIALCCSSPPLISLLSFPTFEHTRLRELTLLSETWHPWNELACTAHASTFFGQLTHLYIHEGLAPEFPRHIFKSLTHFAFSSRSYVEFADRHIKNLAVIPTLECIVITSYWYYDRPPTTRAAARILDVDKRLSLLHCRRGWSEVCLWRDGVSGGPSLWDLARRERASILVSRRAAGSGNSRRWF